MMSYFYAALLFVLGVVSLGGSLVLAVGSFLPTFGMRDVGEERAMRLVALLGFAGSAFMFVLTGVILP